MAIEFPTTPTPEMPYYQDGNYSKDPAHVSPEGNVYGHIRPIAKVPHYVWWTGAEWSEIKPDDVKGQADSFAELPSGVGRPFGEVWQVWESPNPQAAALWREYFWDSENELWSPVQWLWEITGWANLPVVGRFVGQGHMVVEEDVLAMWTGLQWERLSHEMLKNDEPHRHLPPGLLEWFTPDVELKYRSRKEIAVEAVEGGSGRAWINGEWLDADGSRSVFAHLPSLEWNSETQSIAVADLEPDTEYNIYWANTKSTAFVTDPWDFRGRLFLSRSTPIDNYLSDQGAGRNARIAGRIQTDSTLAVNGGPFFLRELDISLISRRPSFVQAFRDYSDFTVEFVDQDTLRLSLLYGAWGQIYIAETWYWLGDGYTFGRTDPWLEWSDTEPHLIRHTEGLSPNTLYYIYIGARVDALNFNSVNRDTGSPWTAEDTDSEGNYDRELDLRLRPFLSPKAPDRGRLSETFPGYYTRLIGQVRTDDNGFFINSRDLSLIRQPSLNPTHFDGLAEIAISPVDQTEFRICRVAGTSGIVMVGGSAIQTYDYDDADVHVVDTSTVVQDYTEANLSAPLSPLLTVGDYPETELYVYMANERTFWGELAERLFVSTHAPVNGYLSLNWPGNNARWLCTIVPDSFGRFTGSFMASAIGAAHLRMDDGLVSLNTVWSSQKIDSMGEGLIWNTQLRKGVPARLLFADAATIKLEAVGDQEETLLLPDGSTLTIPVAGLTLNVTGEPDTMVSVYANASGLYQALTPPDKTYENLCTLGTDSVLVGWFAVASTDTLAGEWNVYSFSHEPTREWSANITSATTTLNLPGLVVPTDKQARLSRTGQSVLNANWTVSPHPDWRYMPYCSCAIQVGYGCAKSVSFDSDQPYKIEGWCTLSHDRLAEGVYSQLSLEHSASRSFPSLAPHQLNEPKIWEWTSLSGQLILTRYGSNHVFA